MLRIFQYASMISTGETNIVYDVSTRQRYISTLIEKISIWNQVVNILADVLMDDSRLAS